MCPQLSHPNNKYTDVKGILRFQFLTLRFFGLVLDLVMYCRLLLYSVCIGPTACLFAIPRSKVVVPVLVLLFVALWFILRGDLLHVFPCVILFLCFSVLLVLRLPPLGKRELILVLFVRLFGLCLFRFVGFLFLLGSGKGCGL